jgi:hypothetical protein
LQQIFPSWGPCASRLVQQNWWLGVHLIIRFGATKPPTFPEDFWMDLVPETLENIHILMRLSVCLRKFHWILSLQNFKSYKYWPICWSYILTKIWIRVPVLISSQIFSGLHPSSWIELNLKLTVVGKLIKERACK